MLDWDDRLLSDSADVAWFGKGTKSRLFLLKQLPPGVDTGYDLVPAGSTTVASVLQYGIQTERPCLKSGRH